MSAEKKYLDRMRAMLSDYYEAIERAPNEVMLSEIRGYTLAAIVTGLFSKEELQAVVDDAHFQHFGMTVAQRRLEKGNPNGEHTDWGYFDTPPGLRNR